MSITIQNATPKDAAALLAYLKQVGGETDNLTFGAEGVHFTVEQEAEFVASMENSKDDIMLVAKDGEKVIGITTLNRLPRRANHRGDFGISVLKDYWNQGIGTKFLQAIIDFAKENKFEVIDLQVRSDNERAIHLYEKFGFRKLGTHPSGHKVNGESIPFDYMCLELK